MTEKSYGSISLRELEKAVNQLKKVARDSGKSFDEVMISFEFLIGSFFPEVEKNVHDEANKQYTIGYLTGFKEG